MKGTEKAGGNGTGQANIDRDIFELMKSEMGVQTLILLGGELDQRNLVGHRIHNKPLTAFDGRKFLREALEEFLDAAVYLRVAMVEEGNPRGLESLYARTLQLAAILKMRLAA